MGLKDYLDYRKMFQFYAVVACVYGGIAIFFPKELGGLWNVDPVFLARVESVFLGRAIGSGMIGIGLSMLVLSEVTEPKVLRNASILIIISNVIGTVIVLSGIYANASFSNDLFFMANIIPHLVFIAGFGYLFYTKAYEQS
ncbi:MAG: hypothetical protein ACXACP_04035 [Candidatus Hodarchaeales archaeon]|jgi:hypothetical protein